MGLKENEFIKVDWYETYSYRDDYNVGQVGTETTVANSMVLPVRKNRNRFNSVEDALKAVCEVSGIDKFNRDAFAYLGDEVDEADENGRFDGEFMVDENNNEVNMDDEALVCAWHKGEKVLHSLHFSVYLTVCTERKMTGEEAHGLGW